MDGDLERLEAALEDWRGFCEFLETEFEPQPAHLLRCLLFSGIRATALRRMEAFPGGANVLPSLAGADTSFHFGRRGIRPDRCLFHVNGCIVYEAKPHKCADFYCASDPGLIHEVVDGMSFDEFALAHLVPLTSSELMERLRTECEMGREFFECKVVIGADAGTVETVLGVLAEALGDVEERALSGGHLDVAVDVPELTSARAARPLVIRCGSVDALGVYELAVALVRARGESVRPGVVVLADEWGARAGAEHPLWRERAMAQPLSALELLTVADEPESSG